MAILRKQVEASITPRTRWRVRIAILLPITIAASAFAYLKTYQPLAPGNTAWSFAGSAFSLGGDTDGPSEVVLLERKDTFEIATTLRNDGPLPITIESLARPRELGDGRIFIEIEPLIGDLDDRMALGRFSPFEPFTLGVGEEKQIAFRFTFECPPRNATNIFEGTTARLSALGVDNEFPLTWPWVLLADSRSCR